MDSPAATLLYNIIKDQISMMKYLDIKFQPVSNVSFILFCSKYWQGGCSAETDERLMRDWWETTERLLRDF